MDQLNYVFNWIAKDIFGVPAYLVGLMTFVALVASRKGWGDIIGGTLKGTAASGDASGFVAQDIGALSVGPVKVTLAPAALERPDLPEPDRRGLVPHRTVRMDMRLL